LRPGRARPRGAYRGYPIQADNGRHHGSAFASPLVIGHRGGGSGYLPKVRLVQLMDADDLAADGAVNEADRVVLPAPDLVARACARPCAWRGLSGPRRPCTGT
jgi:hypothetical protein